LKLKHVVKSQQFSRELLEELFALADTIRSNPKLYANTLVGKVMATLFYEPSTRTRLSFETAMLRLGGAVVGTENAGEFSSAAKGESLADTIRVVSSYADVVVLRHKEEGAAQVASALSKVPVINAGDGRGQHPTQSLIDLYTLYREFGHVDGLKIAFVGDLANGRTVRSLAYLCAKFKDISFVFVSPPNLAICSDIKEYLTKKGIKFVEDNDFARVAPTVDVIYMTRIQKERMDAANYEMSKGKYVINEGNLNLMKPTARILHPLPHVEEISLSIETENNDARVAYFRQVENGLYARMALLYHLLN